MDATFTVTLSAASGQAVTVNYETANGTATQPTDYTPSNGTLTFAPGETSKTITVAVKGDTLDEINETFNVNLATPVNATITDNLGVGTITDDDTAPTVTLSRNNAGIAEASGTSIITATLSAASSLPVTIDLGFTGTATLTSDYTRTGAQIVIPAGQTTGTVTVTAVQDTIDEVDETVIVDITGVTNGTEATPQQVTVAITDDDVAPTLSINDVTVTEGNTGTVNATFTVTLSATSGQAVTVNYATANGTAIQPDDYTSSNGTLTFTAGETTKTITVAVKGDTLDEINETFNVDLATPVNATITDNLGVGTITDNDAAPTVTLSRNNAAIAEAAGTSVITATLSAASSLPVTINFGFTGTATLTSDYARTATQIVIPAGQTTGTVTVTAVQDTLDEVDETIIVDITGVANGTEATPQQVTVTITDDDLSPTLSINDVAVTETNTGTATVTFSVTLSAASSQTVSVAYATSNGSAVQPTDYTSTSGTLTFQPGETSKTFTVAIVGDLLDEVNETFNVSLSSPTNATVADGTGVGTITDDDATPTLSIDDLTIPESNTGTVNATFTVTLSAASGQAVTVNYETANGTATQPADYTPGTGTLTFAPGETSKTITVAVKGDTLDENNETFNVNLATPVNATITKNLGVGTITDDDLAPTVSLSVNKGTMAEAAGTAIVTATLSAVSALPVTIDLGFTGTATSPNDYTRPDSKIVIPAGQTTGTLTLTSVQDASDEIEETIIVDIIGTANATEATAQQVSVAITDDDSAPGVTLTVDKSNIDENGGVATFTVTLSEVSGQPVTVGLEFTGTGTLTSDYTRSAVQSIVIPAGQKTGTFTVTAVSDAIDEPNETVIIDITNVTNGIEATPQQARTTITDDDPTATVTLSRSLSAIREAGGTATITATLSAISGLPVTVDLAFSGTATNLTDYTRSGTRIVIAPGSRTGSVTLTATTDALDESNETIVADILNVTGGLPGATTQATVSITDDDATPQVTLAIDKALIVEAGGTATFTATLSAVSGQPVTVALGFTGTGVLDANYSRSSNQIVIPPGQTSGTLTITALPDANQVDESVTVAITGVTNGTEMRTQVQSTKIIDDEAPPRVSLAIDKSILSEAAESATVTATLSHAFTLPVTLNLEFSGRTTFGTDYRVSSSQITIPAGSTTGTITITAIQDDYDGIDTDEDLVVGIQSAVNANTNSSDFGSQTATTKIVDDGNLVFLSVDRNTIYEGGNAATFTARMDHTSRLPVTVNLAFSGDATLTNDYLRSGTQIVIPAGSTIGSVTVNALNDSVSSEAAETIVVDIRDVVNARESRTQQAVTRISNKAGVQLSVDRTLIAESGTATVTATLLQAVAQATEIQLEFGGVARVLSDYTISGNANGLQTVRSVVIPAGQLTGSLVVTSIKDTATEADETVMVDISRTSGSLAEEDGVQRVITTITDLPKVTLAVDKTSIAEAGGVAVVTATLSAVSGLPVTVSLAASGTVDAVNDVTGSAAQIVIPAGSTSASITVTAKQDSIDEVNETLTFDVTAVTNSVEQGTQRVTTEIIDDDAAPTVALTVDQATIAEAGGVATFTATLSQVSSLPVRIDLTYGGTAFLTDDYTRTAEVINIPAGSLIGTVKVTAVQDLRAEADESVVVFATNSTNASIGNGLEVRTTIINDDPAGFTLNKSTATVTEAGASETFTVVLTAQPSADVVLLVTSSDPGEARVDKPALTFNNNNWNVPQTVTITGVNDNVVDGNQTSIVTLSVDDTKSDVPYRAVADKTLTVTTTHNDRLLDFGDAPTPYPVTLAQNGAQHAIGTLKLGLLVDAEANGVNSVNAAGDGADDDGVILLASLVSSTVPTTSSVTVSSSGIGKLDAWIDFNKDGDWLDAGEQVLTSAAIAAGENLFSFNVPANSASGNTAARFRLSSAGGLAPTGLANDGEVEDYLTAIVTGSATAALEIEIPGGDSAISIEGDNLIVRKGTTIISKVPFASFGNLKLNGSDVNDVLQLTILESLALQTLEFDGGLGTDFLELVAAGQTLDLTNVDITLRDIEGVDLTGTGNNKLVISIDAVKEVSSTTDVLQVVSDAGDTIVFGDGWKTETPKFIDGVLTHIVSEVATGGTARLEIRNNRPLTNPLTPADADRDGRTSPLDALRIINELSRRGAGSFTLPTNDSEVSRLYFDVSGDMKLTALDALRVINAVARLSREQRPTGEGEAAPVIASNTPVSSIESSKTSSLPIENQGFTDLPKTSTTKPQAATSGTVKNLDLDAIDDYFVRYDQAQSSASELDLQLLSSKH